MIIPVSFSSLDCYSKCALSYYYKYVIHEKVGVPDYTGTLPGNVCHNLAERFFSHWVDSKEANFSIFHDNFEDVFNKYLNSSSVILGPDAFAKDSEEAKNLIKDWMLNLIDMINNHGLLKNYVIVEHRFGGYKNPLKITDKLYLTGGHDYFGSESKNTPGILTDWKASDHTFHINNRQLYLYAIGLNKQLGIETAMAGFFLFKSREVSWTRVSKERISDTISWAENIIDNIASSKFEPTSSSTSCNMCDFKCQCKHSSFVDDKIYSIKKAKNLRDADILVDKTPEL